MKKERVAASLFVLAMAGLWMSGRPLFRAERPRAPGSAPASTESSSERRGPASYFAQAVPAPISQPVRRNLTALKINDVPAPGEERKPEASSSTSAAVSSDAPVLAASGAPAVGGSPRSSASAPSPATAGKAAPGDRPRGAAVGGGEAAGQEPGWSPQASGVVDSAKALRRTAGELPPAMSPLEAAVARRIEADSRVDTNLRSVIAERQAKGLPVTREALRPFAESALAANGLLPEPIDVDNAMSRALRPPDAPAAAGGARRPRRRGGGGGTGDMTPFQWDPAAQLAEEPAATQEEPEGEAVDVLPLADTAPPLPAPRGTAEYPGGTAEFVERNRPELERAQRLTGVPYESLVALTYIETTWGGFMGAMPIEDALAAVAEQPIPEGASARERRRIEGRRQVARGGLAALRELRERGLNTDGWMGSIVRDDAPSRRCRRGIDNCTGGGIGHAQFLASTWVAEGHEGNPTVLRDALLAAARKLRQDGYGEDPEQAFLRYNYHGPYVRRNIGMGQGVRRELRGQE